MSEINVFQVMLPKEPKIVQLLDKYRIKNSKIPIVVEGKKDVLTLRKMSFAGDIIPVNSGGSVLNFTESLAKCYDEVIILTDFDRRGKILKGEIEKYLINSGKVADIYLWDYMAKMMPISTVEELPFAVDRIVDDWVAYHTH